MLSVLRTGRGLCLILAFFLVIPGAAAAAGSGPSSSLVIAEASRVPLRDLGRAAGSMRIDLAVTLKYRDEPQLEALIAAASDPASPEFGHYLTPQQFADSFAPTATEYQRLAAIATSAGFTIRQTFANRSVLDVSGPASLVEKYFGTEIHRVAALRAATPRRAPADQYANVRAATLPPSLRDLVFSIGGFDNLAVVKALNVRAPSARTDLALGPPLQGPDTGLGPYAFAAAYDFPVQHPVPGGKAGQTYDGSGHVAGVVIDSDILDSDLSSFLSYFNVTRTGPAVARINVDGGSGGVTFDQTEATLDAETIGGISPGAGIALYLIPQLSFVAIVDAYNTAVSQAEVDVVNSSFGGCEIGTIPATFPQTADHIAEQGAAEGITFAAASGDLGADVCIGVTSNFVGVSIPASGPHFTAVGGTSLLLTPTPAYRAEFAWSGSGGGVSTLFPVPAYQAGVANILRGGRNVPDIAFDANPGTGAAFLLDGFFQGPIGGTSLASPIFSALVTQINQVHAKRSGLLNYALYSRVKAVGYGKVFRDVKYGSNAYIGAGYNALPGYDQVTGIGSIVGAPYAK